MRALQGKRSSGVMIKQRGLPLGAVMALRARRYPRLCKLLAVDVRMARFAFAGCGLEVDIPETGRGSPVRWLVAIETGCGLVHAEQRERGLRMIEARQFLPQRGGMADFAADNFPTRCGGPHKLRKLPLVRIDMASGAGNGLPVIQRRGLGFELRGLLVTIATGDGYMAAGQYEACVFVTSQPKSRRH